MTSLPERPMDALQATSFLFVPGDRPDRFDKAVSRADVAIIDLEDAVAAGDKPQARDAVAAWLRGGGVAAVRVNAAGTSWHQDDVSALAGLTSMVVVPKVQAPDELLAVRRVVGDGVRLVALIETPRGVADVRAICAAGADRLALGNLDLAAELGVDPTSAALLWARSALVYASSEAGLPGPVDGVTSAIGDDVLLREDCLHARDLGFTGKLCIHPRQVGHVNDAFAVTEAELTWARGVVASGTPGLETGVLTHEGHMVDAPVLRRAHGLLAREQLPRDATPGPGDSA
ncbi:MAG: aldolase [Marmoricola sp.]|nr:aldolase [Marmoricola sp.]